MVTETEDQIEKMVGWAKFFFSERGLTIYEMMLNTLLEDEVNILFVSCLEHRLQDATQYIASIQERVEFHTKCLLTEQRPTERLIHLKDLIREKHGLVSIHTKFRYAMMGSLQRVIDKRNTGN